MRGQHPEGQARCLHGLITVPLNGYPEVCAHDCLAVQQPTWCTVACMSVKRCCCTCVSCAARNKQMPNVMNVSVCARTHNPACCTALWLITMTDLCQMHRIDFLHGSHPGTAADGRYCAVQVPMLWGGRYSTHAAPKSAASGRPGRALRQ